MEGSFTGDSERCVKASSESRDLSKGGLWADHKGRPLSGDFERKVTFCFFRQICSLGTADDKQRRLWKKTPFSIWGRCGNWRGPHTPCALEESLSMATVMQHLSLYGSSLR